jgi:hypothetical protein
MSTMSAEACCSNAATENPQSRYATVLTFILLFLVNFAIKMFSVNARKHLSKRCIRDFTLQDSPYADELPLAPNPNNEHLSATL